MKRHSDLQTVDYDRFSVFLKGDRPDFLAFPRFFMEIIETFRDFVPETLDFCPVFFKMNGKKTPFR